MGSETRQAKRPRLDEQGNQLLCYCYEGNLLALAQAIERLCLLYPDGKLTLPRVEAAVNDASHFTAYHWIDALLAGKTQRAWHILQQLKREDIEPVILLRTLQRELMQLITLHRSAKTASLKSVFDQHRIWQNRRPILPPRYNVVRASITHCHAITTQIEITLNRITDKTFGLNFMPLAYYYGGKSITGRIYSPWLAPITFNSSSHCFHMVVLLIRSIMGIYVL